MENICIKTEYIKLGQLLKLSNLIGQGSDAKIIINEGMVKVNGVVVIQRGKKIYPGDIVSFEDKEIIKVATSNK